MTTIAQIWTSFILSNVIPKMHTSDLPRPRCFLLHLLLIGSTVDVASIISDEIRTCAFIEFNKKQERVHKTFGFPALITQLCRDAGVAVNPTKPIRPSIDRKFIEKYCTERSLEQPADHPSASHRAQGRRAYTQEAQYSPAHLANLSTFTHSQNAAIYRALLHQHQAFSTLVDNMQTQAPYSWPSTEDFVRAVAWPGDSPVVDDGAAPGQCDIHMGDAAEGVPAMEPDHELEEEMRDPVDDIISGI